jgi:RND family efflux transporter MFP subunit
MKRNVYLLALATLLLASGCKSTPEEQTETIHSVLVVQPQLSSQVIAKSYSGVVQESKTISLGFKTAGQIKKTMVKEGDYVKQGQLIAILDDVDYQLALNDAQIQYEQMANEKKRLDYLHSTNNLSDNDYEKSVAGLERLKVQLQNAKNRIKYTRLYAPTSGYVTKLNFENAEMVDAGTPVIELMDNSSLEVVVDLPAAAYRNREGFIGYHGKTADGETFSLALINITPKVDNTQLYSMRLAVPAASRSHLTAGQSIEVIIDRSDKTDATESEVATYEIPLHSVFYNGEQQPCVWVLGKDSTVVATPVTMGSTTGKGNVEVSGLNGSETIIRAGVNSLKAGEKVRVIEDGKSTNVGNLL